MDKEYLENGHQRSTKGQAPARSSSDFGPSMEIASSHIDDKYLWVPGENDQAFEDHQDGKDNL